MTEPNPEAHKNTETDKKLTPGQIASAKKKEEVAKSRAAKAAEAADGKSGVAQQDSVALDDGPELKRRSVSRGSNRRLLRAMTAFEAAFDTFIKEVDLQLFMADDEGKRVGEWPFIGGLRESKAAIKQEMDAVLYPSGDGE